MAFGFAALLTLVVAIVAIVSIRSLGQNLSSVAELDRLLQAGAIELRLAVEQESEAIQSYLLTGDQEFLDELSIARSQYSGKLEQLQGLDLSSEGLRLLSIVDSLHNKFFGIATEQTTLRDMGFSKAAVFLWQTQGNEVKVALDDRLVELVARQETIINEHTNEARLQQNQTLFIDIGLVLFTWVVVILGWLWISRSITGPMSQLVRATEEIGKGKLDTEVKVTEKNEFGLLGSAMNRMTSELNESRKVADNLFRREQRRADQMRTVNEVGRQISSILDLNKLLPTVAELLQKTFHYYNVNIFLVEPNSGKLVLRAFKGGYEGEISDVFTVNFGEGIIGWVAKTGEPLVAADVRQEARYRYVAELANTQSELAVPIKAGNEILGVLDIQSDHLNAFDENDIFTAQTLSNQLAVAVNNARLYEQAKELATLEERQRLARDLHDAVSQTLFSASLISEVLPRLWERNENEGRKRLEEVRQLTRGALAEMRTLLLELRPAALYDAEPGDLLRQLGESITGRARIPVSVTVNGRCHCTPDVKVAVYRIAQEALNNVAKHSGAKQAVLSLNCEEDSMELMVSDNGKGFEMSSAKPGSFGLENIRERARGIGADISIESQPGRGTTVRAVLKNAKGGEND
jgi:signal transduction histidine kinase